MKEVTKTQLAKHLGITPAMVSKHVRKGTLDKCYTSNGKKLYLEKAVAAISEARRDFVSPMSPHIEPKKSDEDIVYSEEDISDINELLRGVSNPSQRVQIQKDFWTAKTNRQKFLKEEGELIYMSDARAAVEEVFIPLNKFLDDLPTNLKSHNQGVPMDAIKWLSSEINRIKKSLGDREWGD